MFITIPKVFDSMGWGTAVGILLFVLVLFAAMTSSIALTEAPSPPFRMSWLEPQKSDGADGRGDDYAGQPLPLGYGPLSNVTLLGMQFLISSIS